MFKALENLTDLIELVETAHQVPLSQNCMVPRAAVLNLLEEIREDFPESLENASEVLAQEAYILDKAAEDAEDRLAAADAEANAIIDDARTQANDAIEGAKRQAERTLADASERADRTLEDARRDAEGLLSDATFKRDKMLENANNEYNRIIEEAADQQAFMVSDAEVVRRAEEEANRIVDRAHSESLALRRDCDDFVDGKLEELQVMLSETLRRIDRDRNALSRGAGVASSFEQARPATDSNYPVDFDN